MQFTMTSKHHRKKTKSNNVPNIQTMFRDITNNINFDMSQIQSTKEQMTLIIVLKLLSDIGISD